MYNLIVIAFLSFGYSFGQFRGEKNPVQEMFTYLFTNIADIQDGLTSSLNIRVSDKF